MGLVSIFVNLQAVGPDSYFFKLGLFSSCMKLFIYAEAWVCEAIPCGAQLEAFRAAVFCSVPVSSPHCAPTAQQSSALHQTSLSLPTDAS